MRKLSGYGPSLVVLATALLVLFAGPGAVRSLTFERTLARIEQAEFDLAGNPVLEQINQAYRDIATIVEPSVVHISAQQRIVDRRAGRHTALSSGSGWIYDDLGHIVTNHHVVEDADRIDVQLHDGDLREAEVVGYDEFTDIAVIRITPGQLHPAVRADPAEAVSQGDLVFAFGSPFDFRFSMSSGIVSGKGRSVGVIRNDYGQAVGYENFIQVDAAINPGNSGGPLTDYRGHVIGMNTAIATGRRGGTLEQGQFAGIGLAIPLEMIEPVVSQLIDKHVVAKGYLGVMLGDLNPRAAADLRAEGFPGHGVVVRSVEDDPAQAAGLEAGDIITHVNETTVASMSVLRSRISSMLPGDEITLRVWRLDDGEAGDLAGSSIDLPVTLGRLPTVRITGTLPDDQDRQSIVELGIARMATSTPRLAEQHDAVYRPGVMILKVVPGSSLVRKLRPGATIIEVMGTPVSDVDEFLDALGAYNLLAPRGVIAVVLDPEGRAYEVLLRVED